MTLLGQLTRITNTLGCRLWTTPNSARRGKFDYGSGHFQAEIGRPLAGRMAGRSREVPADGAAFQA
jgi:hypothetical protein